MTRPFYNQLIKEFRLTTEYRAIAKKFGCGERFISRAYNEGWATKPQFVPIKLVLEQESLEASARYQRLDESTQEQRQKIYELARQQAVNARVEEHALVGTARSAAQALVQQSLDLIHAQRPITEKLVEKLTTMAEEPAEDLDTMTLLKIHDKITHHLDVSVKAMHKVIDANRLLRANPEETDPLDNGETMTDDEIREELVQIEHTKRHLNKGLRVVPEDS